MEELVTQVKYGGSEKSFAKAVISMNTQADSVHVMPNIIVDVSDIPVQTDTNGSYKDAGYYAVSLRNEVDYKTLFHTNFVIANVLDSLFKTLCGAGGGVSAGVV